MINSILFLLNILRISHGLQLDNELLPDWLSEDLLFATLNGSNTLWSSQSLCTPDQIKRQTQCFLEVPAETYEIPEGDMVRMRCRVLNQKGKAQWRAKSTFLGYDRTIPAEPTYSMQGDSNHGQHDLVISQVSPKDEGEYECQVTPADRQPQLRHSTFLNVLVKPERPVILAPPGEPQPTDQGRIVVASDPTDKKLSQTPVKFICSSKGGKPAPDLEWFHNGELVKIDKNIEKESRVDGQIIRQAEITLNRTKIKAGDRLVCMVSNKATLKEMKLDEQKLRNELLVDIQSPVGHPEITGVNSNIWDENETLRVQCTAIPAGVPSGKLSFGWTNASQKNLVRYISEQRFSDKEDKLSSILKLPQLSRDYHGDRLNCIATNALNIQRTTGIDIRVRFPFDKVTIFGVANDFASLKSLEPKVDRDADVRYLHKNRPQFIACATDEYYGDPIEIMVFGRKNLDENRLTYKDWESIELDPSLKSQIPGQKNKAAFQMIQGIRVDQLINNYDEFECRAEFGIDPLQKKLKRVYLASYQPPGKPVITEYDSGDLMSEGIELKLSCYASTGKPIASLIWYESDQPHPSLDSLKEVRDGIITEELPGDQIKSSILIHLSSEKNGKYYLCGATNRGFDISHETLSDEVKLNVSFMSHPGANLITPSGLGLTIQQPHRTEDIRLTRQRTEAVNLTLSDTTYKLIPQWHLPYLEMGTKQTVELSCQSGLANPPANIIWKHWRCPKTEENFPQDIFGVISRYRRSLFATRDLSMDKSVTDNCVAKVIQGKHEQWINSNEEPGLRVNETRLGSIASSRLSLTSEWYMDSDVIECLVTQDLRSLGESSRFTSSSASVQILVRFKPEFLVDKSNFLSPSVHKIPQLVIIEGGKLDLDLKPRGNPVIENIRWLRNNQPFHSVGKEDPLEFTPNRYTAGQGAKIKIQSAGARLVIDNVDETTMANYTIVAENTLGVSHLNFFLNVTHGPRLIGPSIVNVTAEGNTAELHCRVRANPVPLTSAVRWRRLSYGLGENYLVSDTQGSGQGYNDMNEQSKLIDASIAGIRCGKSEWNGGFKYYASCSQTDDGVLESIMYIYSLNKDDVGRYQCLVDNGIGSPSIKSIDLIFPSEPKYLPFLRWQRSAPTKIPTGFMDNTGNSNSLIAGQSVLTCIFYGEPNPIVVWTREPANQTLIEGGQLASRVDRIRPGIYMARLTFRHVKPADLGRYYCKGTNLVGSDVGSVLLTSPSSPDIPSRLEFINSTASSVGIRWTQGYNGGPKQIFVVRWANNESPQLTTEKEIEEDENTSMMYYVIKSLTKATTYQLSVASKNEPYGSQGFTDYILATTLDRDKIRPSATGEGGEKAMGDEATKDAEEFGNGRSANMRGNHLDSSRNQSDSSMSSMAIILIASIFGIFVFIANSFLLVFYVKRKRSKNRLIKSNHLVLSSHIMSKSDGLELCTNPSLTGHQFTNPNDYLLGNPMIYPMGAPLSNGSDLITGSTHYYPQIENLPDNNSTKGSLNLMLGMKTNNINQKYTPCASSLEGSLEPSLGDQIDGATSPQIIIPGYQGPQDAGLSVGPDAGTTNIFNYSSLQYQNHLMNQRNHNQIKFMNTSENIDYNASTVRPVLLVPDTPRSRQSNSPSRIYGDHPKLQYSHLGPPSQQTSNFPSPRSGSPSAAMRGNQILRAPCIGRFPTISPHLGMRHMTSSYHITGQDLSFAPNEIYPHMGQPTQQFARRNSCMPVSGNEPVYSTHAKMMAQQPMTPQHQHPNYLQYYYPSHSNTFGLKLQSNNNTIYGTIHKRNNSGQQIYYPNNMKNIGLPSTGSVDELASHLDTNSNVAESVIIPPPNDFMGSQQSRGNSVGPTVKNTSFESSDNGQLSRLQSAEKTVSFAAPVPPERKTMLK